MKKKNIMTIGLYLIASIIGWVIGWCLPDTIKEVLNKLK